MIGAGRPSASRLRAMSRLLDPSIRRRALQFGVDALLAAAAFALAFKLRFLDIAGGIPERYEDMLLGSIAFVAIGQAAVYEVLGQHQKWWRYFRLPDLWGLVRAAFLAVALMVLVFAIAQPFADDLPRSVVVFDFLMLTVMTGGGRLLRRTLAERPARAARKRKARKVLVVGAGSGGQMVVREMQLNPNLGNRAIGFVDDDPRKRGMRNLGLDVLGTTDEIGEICDRTRPDEVFIAIPSAPGVLRGKVVHACRERDIRVQTLPTVFELLRGGVQLTRQLREVQVEDVLGRDPVVMELDRVGRLPPGQDRAGDRRRRLDRRRALTPDRPRRAAPADPARPRRGPAVRDRPRAHRRVALHGRRVGPRRLQGGRPDARGDAALQARGRLPRRRLQARAADGGQPAGGRAQQRDRDPRHRRDGRRGRRRAIRAGLDRQGRQPADGDGRLEGDGRVDHCRRRAAPPAHQVHQRAVRQRAGVLGQRGPDLPLADRARRAGDRHPPGDVALLHDDPRGGAAGHPGRRPGRGVRRGVRARDGRAGEDRRPRPEHDHAGGAGARYRHRDRVHRAATGREAPRGAVQRRRGIAADRSRSDRSRRPAPAPQPRLGRANRRRARGDGRLGRRDPSRRAGGRAGQWGRVHRRRRDGARRAMASALSAHSAL